MQGNGPVRQKDSENKVRALNSSRKQGSRGNENWKLWNKIFSMGKKIDKHTLFSMKINMMDMWMQIEGRKMIFIMNFSVLDFFKFASRMPQIAQILVSTFTFFTREHAPRTLIDISSFFSLAVPGSAKYNVRQKSKVGNGLERGT